MEKLLDLVMSRNEPQRSVCLRIRLGIESDHAEVVPRFTPNVIARPVISSWPELN
jgi:hypothetical protein